MKWWVHGEISRPLFTIIFRPQMLKFHQYSILTRETMVIFRAIYCVKILQWTFTPFYTSENFCFFQSKGSWFLKLSEGQKCKCLPKDFQTVLILEIITQTWKDLWRAAFGAVTPIVSACDVISSLINFCWAPSFGFGFISWISGATIIGVIIKSKWKNAVLFSGFAFFWC